MYMVTRPFLIIYMYVYFVVHQIGFPLDNYYIVHIMKPVLSNRKNINSNRFIFEYQIDSLEIKSLLSWQPSVGNIQIIFKNKMQQEYTLHLII